MGIEVPFNYINILAFLMVLKYENRRGIKVETLKNFLQMVLDKILEEYKNKNVTFYNNEGYIGDDIVFFIKEDDSIDNFLVEYDNYFYMEDDTIYIYDNIKYDDLYQEQIRLEKEEQLGGKFTFALVYNDCFFDLLGIKKIKNTILRYKKIEDKLEKYYYKLDLENNSKELKLTIKKLLLMRALFLNNVSQNEDYVIDAYRLESFRIDNNECEYEENPLNLDLWKNSEYFKDNVLEDLCDLEDLIYSDYQYAVFGNTSLSVCKIMSLLQEFPILSKEFDKADEGLEDYDMDNDIDSFDNDDNLSGDEVSFECFVTDLDKVDLIFYLNYLDKLNKYMKKYGRTKDLIDTRNRLLYVLDTHELCLFEEDNFNKQLEIARNSEIEEDDYELIKNEIRFMADEIFRVDTNINTIKKLLFISTYYELTNDKEIEKIMNKYSNHKYYNFYSYIVFGDIKGYSKRFRRY